MSKVFVEQVANGYIVFEPVEGQKSPTFVYDTFEGVVEKMDELLHGAPEEEPAVMDEVLGEDNAPAEQAA